MVKKEKPPAIVMTDGKREIIRKVLSEYEIQTTQDIQEALKDLLSGTIKEMMEIEMSRHLGYEKSERFDSDNARNGHKSKRVKSSYGNFSVEVPQDRKISDTIEELYGFEVSDSFVSDVTDKILPQIQEWQTRPLEEVYPVVFIDATHYSVRDNGVVGKLAAYVILAINCDGRKKVLSIEIGEN